MRFLKRMLADSHPRHLATARAALRSLVLCTTLSITCALTAFSQESASDSLLAESTPPQVSAVNTEGTLVLMTTAWQRALNGIQTNDVKAVNDAVLQVEELRKNAGYRSVDDYSMVLIRAGEAALADGDIDSAAFYTRSALRLSPDSPRILLDSAPMVYYTGVGSATSNVWAALMHLPRSPVLCISIVARSIYPVLLAITMAVYIILMLYIVFWMSDLLRGMAGYFPPYIRGIATPLVTVILLAVPISFGPLICAVAWSLVLWISDRRRRWPCLMTGVLLLAWSFVAPLREKLFLWSEVPGTRVVLDVTSGTLGGIDNFELETHLKKNPEDGAGWFILGQLKRKSGDYAAARVALARAEMLLSGNPSVVIELATVYALQGEVVEAQRLIEDAHKAGASSAEYYFNRSKIEMLQLDTAAARESMLQAERKDGALARELKQREESLGHENAVTYADARLSMWTLLGTLAQVELKNADAAPQALFPGFGTGAMAILAVGLFGAAMIPPSSRKGRRVSPYYTEYVPSNVVMTFLKLVPGGQWIIENRPIRGAIILGFFLILAMPLVAWPADARLLLEQVPSIWSGYLVLFCVMTLGIVSWGLLRGDR